MLVMILCIGVSLTVTINDFLNDCDETYTTTALFEYMGAAYPDETVYDPNLDAYYDAFDSSLIEASPCVKQWDSTAVALGYIDGITGKKSPVPYRDSAVIVVRIDGYKDSEEVYSGKIAETLYSYNDTQGLMVYIDSTDIELEMGHYYLIHGEFYQGRTSYMYLRPAPYQNIVAKREGIGGTVNEPIVDITTADGGYDIPSESVFPDIADTYAVVNSSVTVHATDNLEALLPFQQAMLYLIDGRSFTEQDYASGAPVCILSEALAKSVNAGLGDQINLSLAVQKGSTLDESYWAGKGFAYTGTYTVIGLMNTHKDMNNEVFIPKSEALDLSDNHFTYTLGYAELYNDKADRFVREITPLLPDRVRMTVYDQGYAGVVKPLKDVLRVAVLITCICAVVCLAIVFLFGFLFVYRQRDTAKIMRRLGAERRNIFSYFLFGSGCISLAAVIVGTAISIRISGWCMELVRNIVARYATDDLYYSNGNLSMVKTIEFASEIRTDILIFTGGIIFLLTICSCFLFADLCIRLHIHRRRIYSARGGTASRSLHGGPLKYAWLSVKRGQFRTFIPIFVSAFVIILLFQLTYTAAVYDARLEELNESTDIKGHFTDAYGRQTSGLNIDGIAVNDLISSGYLSKISVTKAQNYLYPGKNDTDGGQNEMPQFTFPASSFAMETFLYKLSKGANIAYTNDLYSVPEFYYSSTIITDFYDGYDASVFGQEASVFEQEAEDITFGIVSTAFMKENDVKLGDLILIVTNNIVKVEHAQFRGTTNVLTPMVIRVIGSYVKAGGADNIYCPLRFYMSPSLLSDKASDEDTLRDYSLSSVHFRLTGSEALSGLKDYLYGKGYSEVNKIRNIRSFITIEDKAFLTTKSAMTQRIWYIDRTFPVLYILIELLAGLIPYILIQLRKREIAIMRGQGTSKARTFFNIFIEQLMLNAAGAVPGILVSQVFFGKYGDIGFILTGVFILCWLAGTVISIHQINRCSVQSILKAEE